MQAADYIQLATKGDEREALSALHRNPDLASARDARGISIVCLAVYGRRAELAAALVAARAELDIFEATCVGDLRRVSQLVAGDAGLVNAVSPDGFSPVGYSAFFGHADLLQELIELGGRIDLASKNGMRVCPLHSAAAHADQAKAVALARIVLQAGADPNARQQGGFTALHEAALNGNMALIDLLLTHGADPAIRNDKGASPADLARSNEHDAAVLMLESH